MARVELRDVSKVYTGGITALDGVDLSVGDGEFLVVVGPSGSGKSTLLRVVAGLEELTAGSVWIDGMRADGLPPHARGVGMVFQTPALYPHLTVRRNLVCGIQARRLPGGEAETRLNDVAGRLGLRGVLERRPRALSGGQRQRVALGRAIMRGAGVLLLDEPLSSLDAPLRAATRADLIDLHQSERPTMILVTHDQGEAMALGDRVAVMSAGRLEQVGAPAEVYRRPATRFVAEFIGTPPMNVLEAHVELEPGAVHLSLKGESARACAFVPLDAAWLGPLRARGNGPVALGLRAEHVRVGAEPNDTPGGPFLPLLASVARREPLGHETVVTLRTEGGALVRTRLPGSSDVRVNDALALRLDLAQGVWFDAETGLLVS